MRHQPQRERVGPDIVANGATGGSAQAQRHGDLLFMHARMPVGRSHELGVPGIDFKATMGKKTLWGVCAASDPDRAVAEPLVGTLRLSARFLGMGWGGVLFGDGSKPGDVMKDAKALAEAKTFFARTPEKA